LNFIHYKDIIRFETKFKWIRIKIERNKKKATINKTFHIKSNRLLKKNLNSYLNRLKNYLMNKFCLIMIVIENLDHISLGTADLEKSIEFYRELLDCEVVEKTDKFALLELDRIIIKLNFIPDYKFPIKNPAAFTISFNLDVDDFTNAVIELEERKIPIVHGPVPVEGGEALLIKDPDGHWIELKYRED